MLHGEAIVCVLRGGQAVGDDDSARRLGRRLAKERWTKLVKSS